MQNTGIKCIVHGKVQGVFFRANTQKIAKKLELTGFVKNLPNGSVEVLAFGNIKQIDKLLEWLKSGPLLAVVDKLEVKNIEYNNNYSDFSIAY